MITPAAPLRTRRIGSAAFTLWLAIHVQACFGPNGSNPDDTDGGDTKSDAHTAGECDVAADCRLVDERCCGCGPVRIDDPVRAVPVDSDDHGAICRVACGPCPELPAGPVTVVADCVAGTCQAVELRGQSYTACGADSECVLQPVSCCGFCGLATMENSYAVNTSSDFEPCPTSQACPDIECGPPEINVEAFCDDGSCAVRSIFE